MGCRVLPHHIWGYTVCLCPTKRMQGLYDLMYKVLLHLKNDYTTSHDLITYRRCKNQIGPFFRINLNKPYYKLILYEALQSITIVSHTGRASSLQYVGDFLLSKVILFTIMFLLCTKLFYNVNVLQSECQMPRYLVFHQFLRNVC